MFELFSISNICLVLMVIMTFINLKTLKAINESTEEQLQIQDKMFKLIRYRRSQELLDFLNKRVEIKRPIKSIKHGK